MEDQFPHLFARPSSNSDSGKPVNHLPPPLASPVATRSLPATSNTLPESLWSAIDELHVSQ
jgi:hypothetical protein